jgi:hypothetical protein
MVTKDFEDASKVLLATCEGYYSFVGVECSRVEINSNHTEFT